MWWCLNQVTAGRQAPRDLAAQLAGIAAGGWRAIEVWLAHWDDAFGRGGGAARRLIDEAGLRAAGACAQGGFFFGTGEDLARGWDRLARRLAQCQGLGVPHLVVVPVPAPERPTADDLEGAAERLHRAGELAAAHGVRLGIEFLKGAPLVNNLPTALRLARAAAHPQVGVVVDTFHLWAGISKLEDLELIAGTPELLSFVHVNDVLDSVPRELWTDADRVLPGDGSFPLPAITGALGRLGYDGALSLELFNEALAARWGQEPRAVSRAAYERVTRLVPDGPPAGAAAPEGGAR